jgi:hypothetical protein
MPEWLMPLTILAGIVLLAVAIFLSVERRH